MKAPESLGKRGTSASNSGHLRRKTWRDWREINPWLFPLPSELAKDPGPIGKFLGRIPERLLRDADRCADPWTGLCANRFIPRGYHDLFRACASVLPAAIGLVRKVYSRGDLVERLNRAKTEAECDALNLKLFPAVYRYAPGWRDETVQEGPELFREFDAHSAHFLKILEKKKGKAAAAAFRPEQPTGRPLELRRPLDYLLVTNWLRCGQLGDPGFMFYSDQALANLFSLLDWQKFTVTGEDITSEQIEQLRGRMGLRKACEKIPLVTDARLHFHTNAIELNTFDAKKAKSEWPKPPLQLRCRIELDGRVLYGGIPS